VTFLVSHHPFLQAVFADINTGSKSQVPWSASYLGPRLLVHSCWFAQWADPVRFRESDFESVGRWYALKVCVLSVFWVYSGTSTTHIDETKEKVLAFGLQREHVRQHPFPPPKLLVMKEGKTNSVEANSSGVVWSVWEPVVRSVGYLWGSLTKADLAEKFKCDFIVWLKKTPKDLVLKNFLWLLIHLIAQAAISCLGFAQFESAWKKSAPRVEILKRGKNPNYCAYGSYFRPGPKLKSKA